MSNTVYKVGVGIRTLVEAGDFVVVINGEVVAVVKKADMASVRQEQINATPPPPPAKKWDPTEIDLEVQILTILDKAGQMSAYWISSELGLPAWASPERARVSITIKHLIAQGKIRKTPGASRLGTYELTGLGRDLITPVPLG